ncbi:MAG: hypothetical protein HY975_02650 [Candidatus Kerfeldbacteria bacterium]|nr:hypothetical protein [Candidatus Kerfeldbacteria bacterium]
MRRPLLSVSLIASLVVVGLAIGVQSKALTLVPPSIEYTTDPGKKIETTVKLFNEASTPVTVTVTTANFGAKGETGEPDFKFDAATADLASWIKPGQSQLTLAAGERVTVPVTISVPANADPGGHYAGIFFGSGGSATDSGQVAIQSKLGTLVILRVEGEIRETATVASFGTKDKKTSYSNLPVTFEFRVSNTGNVHIRPQGTVLIKNLFGGESATFNLNDVNGAVLPNSIRAFDVTWKKLAATNKRSNFFQKIGNEWKNFALGPYTATASVTYGQTKQNLVATARVTVMPWELLIVMALVIAGVILLIVFGVRAYNTAIIRRAESKLPPPSGLR